MARKEDNLKPVRTHEEAVERGRKGGIASGEARERKKNMKEATRLLLRMPVVYRSVKDGMKQLGIDSEEMTNQMAIIVSMYKEAMSGNVKAAEFLRATLGDEDHDREHEERWEMEKERHRMEMKRMASQMADEGTLGEKMPTIVNVRPAKKEKDDEQQ